MWVDTVRLAWWCLLFGMMLILRVIVGFIGCTCIVDVMVCGCLRLMGCFGSYGV